MREAPQGCQQQLVPKSGPLQGQAALRTRRARLWILWCSTVRLRCSLGIEFEVEGKKLKQKDHQHQWPKWVKMANCVVKRQRMGGIWRRKEVEELALWLVGEVSFGHGRMVKKGRVEGGRLDESWKRMKAKPPAGWKVAKRRKTEGDEGQVSNFRRRIKQSKGIVGQRPMVWGLGLAHRA